MAGETYNVSQQRTFRSAEIEKRAKNFAGDPRSPIPRDLVRSRTRKLKRKDMLARLFPPARLSRYRVFLFRYYDGGTSFLQFIRIVAHSCARRVFHVIVVKHFNFESSRENVLPRISTTTTDG